MIDCGASVSSLVEIDLLDVSLHGALIRCSCPLRVNDRAHVRGLFNGQPLIAWVRVVRVSREATGALRAGVVFTSLDHSSHSHLRRTLTP